MKQAFTKDQRARARGSRKLIKLKLECIHANGC